MRGEAVLFHLCLGGGKKVLKIGKNKKGKNDLSVLLLIKRANGIERRLTYGRRAISTDGDYFFKIKSPFGSTWYEMPDVPSEFISINRVVIVYTPDLINFYAIDQFKIENQNQLNMNIIKVDNREWFKKALIRKMKRAQKGWMDEHKAFILTIIMIAFVGIILWLLISNLGSNISTLNSTLSHLNVPVPLAHPQPMPPH